MEQIDWSKAPEGATHARYVRTEICGRHLVDFFKKSGSRFEYWNIKHADWRDACSSVHECVEKPPVWSGTGLPPVGIEFEWRYGDHAWKTGSALYIGSVYVILKERDDEQHYYLRDMQFRPIRTPEQIAAEQRNAAQKAIQDLILSCFKIDKITAAGIAGVVADAD